ncbi:hypothetical protein Acr_12g0001810 [Actinidia rufa]|uniref:Uncharacterized protein n=1 Tax=Actinidia rufa TaxID=165716 RepID=A0A7J0FG12_9ERIC|nr:hypothetical protein Acr_12g0001810 [Actinidia rufa]
MKRPRTKYASNDLKGDGAISSNTPPLIFKPRLFKNLEIQATWVSDFKERAIITRWNIDIEFLEKYQRKMMELIEAQGWEGLVHLPTDIYSTLVRLLYYKLEVGTLENDEFTIDKKVSFLDQHNQFIDGGFTEHLISHGVSVDSTDNEEDEGGGEEINQQPLEIDNCSNTDELPSNSE